MKRLVALFVVAMLWSVFAIGQTKLNDQKQEQFLHKINVATTSMKTMRCDFVQTKKMKLMRNDMVSKGIMCFSSPNKLRWEYNAPYSYVFVLNGEKVSVKSAKVTQNIDVQQNKMFRQLSKIILNSVTGGHLKSSADFNVEIWKNKDKYTARLLPKKKELKKLYRFIEISFNTALTMVETVRMEEMTGDITIVNLKNVKINQPISENNYSIN